VYLYSGGVTPSLPGLPTVTTNPQPENQPAEAVSSFGAPLKAATSSGTGRSAAQLDGSLFPIACTPERTTAAGYAYTIATEGLDRGEVAALTTAGSVRVCLADRVAYLFDASSTLQVRIESYDATNGLVLLRVPAPLPGQPIATDNNGTDRQIGSFQNGRPVFLPTSDTSIFPGAPLLDTRGNLVAVISDARTPIGTATFCQQILSC
jgi:hypothetical protein